MKSWFDLALQQSYNALLMKCMRHTQNIALVTKQGPNVNSMPSVYKQTH